jgi:hypothetical protein
LKPTLSVSACFSILVAVAIGLAACGGDDTAPAGEAQGCSINSECNDPLVCAFKRCHQECNSSRDCTFPQRCVVSTDSDTGTVLGKVCQLPDEADKRCAKNSDCPGLQICGIDAKCRDQCAEDRDCPISTYRCINRTCAAPEELTDRGGLETVLDSGIVTRDGEVINPNDDGGASTTTTTTTTTTSTGMGGAGGGGPDAGGDVSMGGSAGTDAGRDASADVSQPPYDGPCGHNGEPCCATGTACTLGATCNSSQMCVTCGMKGAPCCATNPSCQSNLDCVANTCQCGESNQVCCGGTMCTSGLTCSIPDAGKSVCACGGNGQNCCPNAMCNSSSLSCAGKKCTCMTGCSGDRASSAGPNVLRSDGSVWFYSNYYTAPKAVADVGGATVTGFTKVVTSYYYSCGIKQDKTAWCWGNGIGGFTNSNGQLGDGTTNPSNYPVQVVKSDTLGDYLTNVVDISTYGDTSCAVTNGGTPETRTAWCWGYGYYGTRGDGDAVIINASKLARPVVTAIGLGAPALTRVDQISVGQYHACAHQASDAGGQGNIWCWGYNYYGQLGNDMTTQLNYAVQTINLGDQASQVAAGGQWTCARTGPDVWCWGYMGQGVGDGTMGAKHVPTQVRVTADAGVFTGATDIRGGASGPCVLLGTGKSVWCWGNTPNPARESSANFPVENVSFWDLDSSNTCFSNSDGELYFRNSKVTAPVSCP